MSSSSYRVPACSGVQPLLRRPVTVLVGHFGSGKTEVGINLALGLRAERQDVTLVDLDIVKPYFRSRSAAGILAEGGIHLVVPGGEWFHADLPIVSPEVRGAVGRATAGGGRVIIDAGGAEVGARVLGSIPGLDDEAVTETLFVVNGRRPFADTPGAVAAMLDEIQRVARLRVTGLVSNSHLMDETTVEVVLEGIELTAAVSERTAVPVRFHAVTSSVASAVAERLARHGGGSEPLLSVDRHIMPPLDAPPPGTKRRSSIV
jgi:hypothetical protein